MNEEKHESTKGRKRERRKPVREGRNSGKIETEDNEGNKGKISAIAIDQLARFTFVTFCSTFFGLLAKRKLERTGR